MREAVMAESAVQVQPGVGAARMRSLQAELEKATEHLASLREARARREHTRQQEEAARQHKRELATIAREKEDELLLAGTGKQIAEEELRMQRARVEQRKAEIGVDRKRRGEEMTQWRSELAAEEKAADAKGLAAEKLQKAAREGGKTASAQR
jgi:hypothetical protein